MITKAQTTIPLAANAQWASSWIDNGANADAQYVSATSYSDAGGTLAIQQSDDPTLPQFNFQIAIGQFVGGNVGWLSAGVTRRFWRLVYTNGATAQTTFQLQATASSNLLPAILAELQKINFQLLSMRGPSDNPLNDPQFAT